MKAPRVEARRVERALLRHGFVMVRQSGSHRVFRHPDGRRVTLPGHAGQVLHPKLLASILDQAGLGAHDLG